MNCAMQRIVFNIFLWIIMMQIPEGLSAQILSGIVFDRKNQEPVPGAHVYLDGSSWIDVTNTEGRFDIKVNSILYLSLVISHVSYQTVTVSSPFTSLPDTIFVEEKTNLLSEVVIRPGRYSRKQLLDVFRDEFLGMSSGARSCKIENEDKIDLWYNERAHVLSASCDEPIRVHNQFLGYRIYVTLTKFETAFTYQQLGVGPSIITMITSSFFEDLEPDNRRIAARRESVYKGSRTHFLRALVTNPSERKEYRLYGRLDVLNNIFNEISFVDCFTVIDSLGMKKIIVNDKFNMGADATYAGRPYFGRLNVVRRSEHTSLIFYTNTFETDVLGNLDKPDILVSGYMGSLRIGDALPANYNAY